MALTPGTKLGPYEIESLLGAGGMGEVYRSRDVKLNREVALKVLPAVFAADPERLARFRREAQVLAALNHPNIAAIYGFEDSEATHALVMEFVDGRSLDQLLWNSRIHSSSARAPAASGGQPKIRSGSAGEAAVAALSPSPLPLDEVLAITRQIAEALEFAHERGIVHRDLKPANIKIRHDGTVKVLDFGLARAFSPEEASGSSDAMNSPTMTGHATQMGMILGTAGYMSPEQAKGKHVDRRADIWAFGVVLYEMLTGKRGYHAEDVSETLAAVLTRDVDWTALPPETPPRLRSLLRDCLARDPKLRLRDIGEARRVLDQLISGTPDPDAVSSSTSIAAPVPTSAWQRALPWTIAVIAVVSAAVAIFTAYRWHASVGQVRELRLQVVTPGDTDDVSLSPDGRYLVSSGAVDGDTMWLRPLDAESAKPLPGTESGGGTFWSPDSKSIGFVANQKLKRIDLDTGAVQTLADAPVYRGGTWNRENSILFAPGGNGPLYRVAAAGGQPVPVTQLRSPKEVSHRFPQFLPDGKHFLFWVIGPPEVEGEYVGSLDGKDFQRLFVPDGPATFAPPDHVFFERESVLYAQHFDPDQIKLTGEPFVVASRVSGYRIYRRRVAASDTDLIAFRPDAVVKRQVTWLDRTGKPNGTVGDFLPDARQGELSPDGHTLAITTLQGEVGKPDIFLMEMGRGTLTRLTTEPGGTVRWSPDGKRIAFNGGRTAILDIYSKVVGSSDPDQLVLSLKEAVNLSDWSPDGKYLLYVSQSPATARDVWALPLEGADRKPFPVVQTPAEERNGRFSPDGKWVAYSSNETGHEEVFVKPFPGPGPALRASTGGGRLPFWRRDGTELYYLKEEQLMAVPIHAANGTLQIGMPQALFKEHGILVPQTDGQRFLSLTPQGEVSAPPVTVIVNWSGKEK